jgi:hypothetical protein
MDGRQPPHFISIKHVAITALPCALACAWPSAFTQSGAIMIAIDKMTVGAAPADFEIARTGQGGPAQWAVVADASAAGGRAIEQTSMDRTDYRFPLAIYQPVSAGNVDALRRDRDQDAAVTAGGFEAFRGATHQESEDEH